VFRWKTTHFITLPVLVLSVIFAAIPPASARKNAAFNGEMNIEDRDANRVASDDFDTAPLSALTLTAEF